MAKPTDVCVVEWLLTGLDGALDSVCLLVYSWFLLCFLDGF